MCCMEVTSVLLCLPHHAAHCLTCSNEVARTFVAEPHFSTSRVADSSAARKGKFSTLSSRELICLTERRDDGIRRSRHGGTTQTVGSCLEHCLLVYMPFLALHVAMDPF